ncbi:MAG: SDR family NAD(P)-dependent oxidoreductase [Leptospirales bacterium]|nr:SDR family NAD(P)-dependent oxidoreductase [Leptospirales bacterium]
MAGNSRKPVALITGAGVGIGRDAALYLAQQGYLVFATMRKPERLARFEAEARELGLLDRMQLHVLDVTIPEQIEQACAALFAWDKAELQSEAPPMLCLINNAGYGLSGAVEELRMDDFRRIMETNYFGAVALTQRLLPYMREHKQGRVVQISSGFGRIGAPLMSAYNASKFALEGFSEALRYEMLPFNVFVSLLEPGPVKTDFSEHMEATPIKESSPYRRLYERADQAVQTSMRVASEARDVSRTIQKACEARYPSLRYEVGLGGYLAKVTNQFAPQDVIEGIYRFV